MFTPDDYFLQFRSDHCLTAVTSPRIFAGDIILILSVQKATRTLKFVKCNCYRCSTTAC